MSNAIQFANLDGSAVADISTGLNGPTTIALDLQHERLYFSDSDWSKGTPRIFRSKLDGFNLEQIVTGGFPWGVAYASDPSLTLVRAVRPAFSDLVNGTRYQLQISSDLNTWTNYGQPFVATNGSHPYPQYWEVSDWNALHFRLQSPAEN